MKKDVIIIGGGAAGLCTAICVKRKNPKLSVLVLEKLPRVGKKLAITGNGRCNITNRDISLNHYHGQDTEFCRYALEKYNRFTAEEFFKSVGVPFVFEDDKAYPSSLQASSVVDALRFECEKLGAEVLTDCAVTDITFKKNGYDVISGVGEFFARTAVAASGLLSGGDRLGCDGGILRILKTKGYKTVGMRPAIVQLKTPADTVRQLKGIKVNAAVTLKNGVKTVRREYGEVLFCDYGLSGPPILQVSGEICENKKYTVSLDLLPKTDFNGLCGILSERALLLKNRTLDEFFTGMLNKRLGQVILKICGCKLSDSVTSLNIGILKTVAEVIKNMSFEVTGNTGFINSQVTSGGIDTSQFSPKSMMSQKDKGLFAVGEILDINGDCGGFNLQWAWSSAMCAADGIISYIGDL